tara:strand:- start:1144 stop:1746 length:603 start_codon:yes stop_codon:yes gene_type:complete
MATYNAIKYNVNYKGFAGALVPLFSTSFTSATGTVQITSGITSAFDEYLFIFNDIRPATDNRGLTFRGSTDGGSSYGIATTTSVFRSAASESASDGSLSYNTDQDRAQSTGQIPLISEQANDSDQALCGLLRLYNPASTTFVKHFLSTGSQTESGGGGADASVLKMVGGYINTTSAINAVKFEMSQGNMEAGNIQMFGVN